MYVVAYTSPIVTELQILGTNKSFLNVKYILVYLYLVFISCNRNKDI